MRFSLLLNCDDLKRAKHLFSLICIAFKSRGVNEACAKAQAKLSRMISGRPTDSEEIDRIIFGVDKEFTELLAQAAQPIQSQPRVGAHQQQQRSAPSSPGSPPPLSPGSPASPPPPLPATSSQSQRPALNDDAEDDEADEHIRTLADDDENDVEFPEVERIVRHRRYGIGFLSKKKRETLKGMKDFVKFVKEILILSILFV